MKEFYTAVGCFETQNSKNGKQHPLIISGKKEHIPNANEMILWTTLRWRLLSRSQIERLYSKRLIETEISAEKTCAKYLEDMLECGLIAKGSGETDADALYDLLAGLYLLPANRNIFTNIAFFLKLTLFKRIPIRTVAREVFAGGASTVDEKRVLKLIQQTVITVAELMKCINEGATDISDDDKLTDALFTDDYTTSENLILTAKTFDCKTPILMAVANLYLRKQIIFTTEE